MSEHRTHKGAGTVTVHPARHVVRGRFPEPKPVRDRSPATPPCAGCHACRMRIGRHGSRQISGEAAYGKVMPHSPSANRMSPSASG